MIKVLHDFILISEPLAEATNSAGLIVLASEESTLRCKVIDIGPGDVAADGTKLTVEVQPGDIVFLPKEVVKNAPSLKHEGVKYLFIKQMQILCWERPE